MATTTRLAVAAPSEAAADAGERVARAGGNAVDAAIAASLVAMVSEVGVVSLSAGGFVTVQPGDGADDPTPYTVDGWMDMPGRDRGVAELPPGSTWDVTTDYGGGVDITIGPGSVAVHGAVAALGVAHERDGRVPWREVVAPAVEVAGAGFRLGQAARYYLDHVHDDIFGWDDESRAALHTAEGEVTTEPIVVPGLAESVAQLAAEGPASMYTGGLAERIGRDVLDRGGLLGPADLAAYRAVVHPCVTSRLGDWTLSSTPPPSVGGVCLTAMLRLLDGWSPEAPDAVDRLVAVQRRVLGHRLEVLDHSDDVATDAAAFLQVIESGSTAHISATDADGGACAITISSGYGSGMVAAGTGIWLNNCLGEQELNPRGLHGSAPGTRLLSNMAPTVGRRADGATLAIGSPGADRITSALAVVLGCFAAGVSLVDAVNHPRVHVHRAGRPDEVVRTEAEPSMYFGGVGATLAEPGGHLVAAADPRRAGAVRVVGG
ncbi:gamma-glutamyltransferase [Nocardioides marinquilinus]|uniref:Gamma-glutamyltransferase n=1 Tax=Nocardioides marinquilinus TaxID=1210400 RepID=A0ABP9PFT8_9ACTN